MLGQSAYEAKHLYLTVNTDVSSSASSPFYKGQVLHFSILYFCMVNVVHIHAVLYISIDAASLERYLKGNFTYFYLNKVICFTFVKVSKSS